MKSLIRPTTDLMTLDEEIDKTDVNANQTGQYPVHCHVACPLIYDSAQDWSDKAAQ